jgi:hypothetical protein
MTYGPDGMWYRAASYDTKEQCLEFFNSIKPVLASRPNAGDNLLTISFGTPDKKYVTAALGYPEPETIALVESLFEQPPVVLSKDDLIYARREVAKLRRAEGISDEEAGERAWAQARNLGMPEPLARSIAQGYTHDLAETHSDTPDSEPAIGSAVYKADRKDLPRELRSQAARMQEELRRKARERARPFFVRFRSHIEEVTREEDFDLSIAIYIEQIRAMNAYLFTESALRLFHAVHEPHKHDFPIPTSDLFIEFPSSLDTPHGSIRAFAISQVENPIAVAKIEHKYPGFKGLSQVEEGLKENARYRLQVIDDAMQFIATEGYYVDLGKWVHSKGCPTGACITEQRAGEEVMVQPCNACIIRTTFWASWVRTLLLIISLEYAVSPDPQAWVPQIVTYEEDGTQRVGKGKNAHVINVTRKREIEYRIVSFDVSKPAPKHERTSQEDEEKRANWLTLASKDQIIYKRMEFDDIVRHYTQHPRLLARCEEAGGKFTEMDGDILREYRLEILPNGTKVVVSKLVPFAKYVPMLREKKPLIRKVVAGAYGQESNERLP